MPEKNKENRSYFKKQEEKLLESIIDILIEDDEICYLKV